MLRVHDDGPGIDPAIRDELFARFARGDSSRARQTGGTGLGLAIAKAIVEGHHGLITVTSEPGDTTFTVRIPMNPGDDRRRPRGGVRTPHSRAGPRALVPRSPHPHTRTPRAPPLPGTPALPAHLSGDCWWTGVWGLFPPDIRTISRQAHASRSRGGTGRDQRPRQPRSRKRTTAAITAASTVGQACTICA